MGWLEFMEPELRVYIVRCFCSRRHCIRAHACELPLEVSEAATNDAKRTLKYDVDQLLSEEKLVPWCEHCYAPSTDWFYELGQTSWETLMEALPFIEEATQARNEPRRD